jgi:hypothetical protein
LSGFEEANKIIREYSAPPVVAALLLTTLLPNTPIISSGDAWLLKYFSLWDEFLMGFGFWRID